MLWGAWKIIKTLREPARNTNPGLEQRNRKINGRICRFVVAQHAAIPLGVFHVHGKLTLGRIQGGCNCRATAGPDPRHRSGAASVCPVVPRWHGWHHDYPLISPAHAIHGLWQSCYGSAYIAAWCVPPVEALNDCQQVYYTELVVNNTILLNYMTCTFPFVGFVLVLLI